MNSGVLRLDQIIFILLIMNKHHLRSLLYMRNIIKLKLYNNCSAQAVNNISEWPMWYLSKSVKFAYLWKERNQLTLNKAHVIEIKAKNSLIVWCREKRVNWKKTEDGGNLFFKALVNRFWLTSWKLFMVQQSCSWTTFYQMDFMKRQWYVYLK